jgi:REP element-mobilizing transposase RayT
MSEKYKIQDQEQLYFITFAVVGWIDVFTRRQYCDLLIESLKYCQREKGLVVYAWCIMSNHIHLIIGRNKEFKLEAIVRDFKKFTSVQLCKAIEDNKTESRREWMLEYFKKAATKSKKHTKYMFWQNEYHPVELSTNAMMDQKLSYIHNNPVEAGIVEKAEAYTYSSAKDYYLDEQGLLEIEFIT